MMNNFTVDILNVDRPAIDNYITLYRKDQEDVLVPLVKYKDQKHMLTSLIDLAITVVKTEQTNIFIIATNTDGRVALAHLSKEN